MRFLALCGSLRAASHNAALLEACRRVAPAGLVVEPFPGLGALPLFNPDVEPAPPPAVRALHAAVAGADALLVASPEYAHGVTGTIKNALDWLVGFEPFHAKPVAVLNASPRAWHADAALRETLATMSARLVGEQSFPFAVLGSGLDAAGIAASPALAADLRAMLGMVRAAVQDCPAR